MEGLLTGKVVAITGAGSGVGRAATLLFTRHGAKVVAADINAGWADETAELARTEGGDVRSVACDVADESSVQKMAQAAVTAFGRLDVMYNNAGITIINPGQGLKTLIETTRQEIDRLLAVNLIGVINGCNAAVAQFNAQGGAGAIVNTASVSGLVGYGGSVYGASKGAVVSLTRTLALELAPRGIRVNSVCPAGMLTHFAGMNPEGTHAQAILKGMGNSHPMGRAIDPLDTANAALFLASDLAANITGVNLPVDGGLCAGIQLRRS